MVTAVRVVVVAMLVVACGTITQPGPVPSVAGLNPTSSHTSPSTGPGATATPGISTPAASVTPAPTAGSFNVNLSVEPFVEGLPPLTLVTHAGDGSGLLYAVGQNGVITIVSVDGEVQPEPFLDIDDRIKSGGEQGLLGLAFHPDYESNGRFFVNYTANNDDTVISEFARSDAGPPVLADPGSERNLITLNDGFPNHNGGMLAFGPDGYLYIGMGDGGGGGDPLGAGQARDLLFGKMLRIDVNAGDPYGIPADNPFVDGSYRPETWSLGWRNPWRWSFDGETGALFIGDVGQGAREEIDVEPPGAGGRNYGWNTMEGDICYIRVPCETAGLTFPVAVNDRLGGECAITGGYVYRGTLYPDLYGAYVFSDFCTGTLWALDAGTALATGAAETLTLGDAGFGPTSFGEDEAGEIYVVNLAGEIYRLVANPR